MKKADLDCEVIKKSMFNLGYILEKILSEHSNKSLFIPVSIIIIIILSVLKIDIEIIKNTQYVLPILIIINVLITMAVLPLFNAKFLKIVNVIAELKELENKIVILLENYNYMIEKAQFIKEKSIDIENISKDIYVNIKGIPNIKALNNMLSLKTRELWADIFMQYLQASVLYTPDASHVIIEASKSNINDYIKKYIYFYKEMILQYKVDAKIIDDITIIIDNGMKLTLLEIEKDKKTEEKLFNISSLLKHMCDDIEKCTISYLQLAQFQLY